MGSINRLRLTPVLCAAAGAAAGYYALFYAPAAVIISVLTAAVTLLCFFRTLSSICVHSRKLQLTSVCAAAAAAGLSLGLCAADAGQNNVNFGIDEKNVTAIEGVLLEDPRIISGGSAMASLSLQKCAGKGTSGNIHPDSSGVITVFFSQVNADKLKNFGRGTAVFAEGTLRSSSYGWSFSARSLHVINPASPLERMRTGIRLNLAARFEKERWGGLALALLLGIRDNLDSGFAERYRESGLSYILALSGMHLAILAAIIAFLLKRPLGLKVSAITGAILIILYCFLVGPMPSLNRSALMYILGVIALLGALPKNSISILSLSFLIQIIADPASGSTLSFALSYAALLGIIITGQAFSFLLAGKIPDFILQPLSLSAGAFLATAGICSFTFGLIAPAGIIAGLLIVPLTTIFMVGSIIWLLLGIFSLSFLLNFPLTILYNLMETISGAAGFIPGLTANPFFVLAFSLALSVLIVVFEYRRRKAMLTLRPFS